MGILKVLISLILILVVLAIIVAVLFVQLPFCIVKSDPPSSDYCGVLKAAYEANPAFGNMPVTRIALLGAHDSLTSDINYNSKPNVNADTASNNKFFYYAGRGLITRMSKAQNDDILTQLKAGVRYIDARITCIDGVYYTCHEVVSDTLEKSLLQILEFLSENSGEYIIFHIVQYYPGTSDWTELDEFIASVTHNGKNLYDYVNYDTQSISELSELTYNNMTDGGTKAGVLFLGEHSEEGNYAKYYKFKNINSVWHNNADSAAIHDLINKNYEEAKKLGNDTLCINQAQTTPGKSNLLKSAIGWSLLDMAAKHNVSLVEDENFDKWLEAMPIFLCDYATCTSWDFNARVNEKISKFNLSLR